MRVRVALVAGAVACAEPVPGGGDVAPADPGATVEAVTVDVGAGIAGASTGTPSIRVEVGPRVTCANPTARGASWYDAWSLPTVPTTTRWVSGGGVATADLDDDGLQEIVAATSDEIVTFRWTGRGWSRQVLLSVDHALPPSESTDWRNLYRAFHGITIVDVDDDGDLDVFVTGNHVANVLLLQGDDGTFADAADDLGLAGDPGRAKTGATWGDVDQDGDLDVVISGHGDVRGAGGGLDVVEAHPSSLMLNEGGVFVDASDRIDPAVTGDLCLQPLLHDFDGDGRLDLLLANDFGEIRSPPRLLLGREGRFVLEDGTLGAMSPVTGMGMDLRDVDGDGQADLLFAGWDRVTLDLRHDDAWFDASGSWGLASPYDHAAPWGVAAVDAENDGDADLLVGLGGLEFPDGSPVGIGREPVDDVVYVNTGGQFERLGPGQGLGGPATTRGLLASDLDGDGWMDLVRAHLEGEIAVAHARCGEASWTRVRLDQPSPNAAAIGARVVVEAGGLRQERWVRAGGTGYASGRDPAQHFGLGDAERIDRLEVTWPDGSRSVATDLDVDRDLRVYRD